MSGNNHQPQVRAKNKFRPLISDRLLAVDMLATAVDRESVIGCLALKHPKHSREQVREGYFPARGVFFISNLLGASVSAIAAAKEKLQTAHDRYSARGRAMFKNLWQDDGFAERVADFGRSNLGKLNQDPIFQQQRAQRNRERLAVLHQDPVFSARRDKIATARILLINSSDEARERARCRITLLNQDSVFQSKAHAARWTVERREAERARMLLRRGNTEYEQSRIDGLQDYWREYRRLKAIGERAYLEETGISIVSRGRQGFFNLGDWRYLPDVPIVQQERYETLFLALATLDEREARVIKQMFFSAGNYGLFPSVSTTEQPEIPDDEIDCVYESALEKLRNHKGLAAVL